MLFIDNKILFNVSVQLGICFSTIVVLKQLYNFCLKFHTIQVK